MMSFADARKAKNFSLEDVSNQIGVSVKTIEFWESNPSEMSISDAVMLTSLYNVDITSIRF